MGSANEIIVRESQLKMLSGRRSGIGFFETTQIVST